LSTRINSLEFPVPQAEARPRTVEQPAIAHQPELKESMAKRKRARELTVPTHDNQVKLTLRDSGAAHPPRRACARPAENTAKHLICKHIAINTCKKYPQTVTNQNHKLSQNKNTRKKQFAVCFQNTTKHH